MILSLALSLWLSAANAKTIHVSVAGNPASLDWTGQSTPVEAPILVNICEGLYTYQLPGGKIVPGVSLPVTRSKDNTEYTFKIRPGAKWSDGREVFAQDFLEAWKRVLSPQGTSIYPVYFFEIVNAREFYQKKISAFSEVGIHAPDDHTLVVKLKQPNKNWEALTTFWPFFPVRTDMIEKFGNNWSHAGVLISNGPFVLESYEPGIRMVLKQNPHYPKTASNVDEVILEFIDNKDTALKKYLDSELQLLSGVATWQLQTMAKRPDFKMTSLLKAYMLSINVDRFPTNNRDFRLALLQAINPAETIPKGSIDLERANTLIPAPLPGSKDPPFIQFNVEEAKEHLKKSGVVLDKNFRLHLLTDSSEPFSSSAIDIKNQLEKNLGMRVNLMIYSGQELLAMKEMRDFNIIDHSQNIKVWNPIDLLQAYSTDSIANERHYSNPIFDQWLEIGKVKEAEKTLITDEGVSLPLFNGKNAYLVSAKLKGVYPTPQGFFIFKNAMFE